MSSSSFQTRRRRRARFLVVGMLASLATVCATSIVCADAAAGAPAAGCFISTVPNGTTLPANVPGVILNDSSQGATATITAELVTGDTRVALVGPVKDTHGLNVVLLPASNPPVGTHVISTTVVCSNNQVGNSPTNDTSIVLTDAVPFPTTVGTLTVRPSSPPTGNDEVILDASPNLRAFFPVVSMKLTIGNDATAASTASPNFDAKNPATPVKFQANTGSACVENGALHREKRTVRVNVTADIAGLTNSPAPATLDIPVDCGAIRWTTENDFKTPKDSTSNNNNNSSGSSGTSGSTTTPSSSNNGSSTSSSANAMGCAASPSSPSSRGSGLSAAVGLFVVVGALVGLRRRRRA